MALLDAKEYDPRPAQRRNRLIATVVLIAVAVAVYLYLTRHSTQIRVINNFFQALEQKNYDAAYGIYQGDPDWKQHPEKYPGYTLNQFVLDWGPQGEYGTITSHHVDCALTPPKRNFVPPSGAVVVVTINNRAEPRSMWVENKTRSISDSPVGKVLCHGQ
ncbi:MAG TPA: hypothetical protein VFT65_16715 [Candidatus Angelobacter sp.]|nr:hypothetical protein [Candidatus Angelobacter sp.]